LIPESISIVPQLSMLPFPRLVSVSGALVALVVALALIFAGRYIIRVVAFFGVGIAFASAGAAFGAVILGIVGFVIGGIFGFFLGGILSFFLLPLAVGVASGLVAYELLQAIVHLYPVSILGGLIFFFVAFFLSMKFLALATAVFGSLILLDVLEFFHFPPLVGLIIAFLMGVIGFWIQDGFESKVSQGYKFASWSRNTPPSAAVSVQGPSGSSAAPTTRRCAYCGSGVDSNEAFYCPNCGGSLGN